jgi:6-phosphogluconolactonase
MPRASRRHFLAASAALPSALRALAQSAASQNKGRTPRFVILGTDKGQGFYRATWDVANGDIGPSELVLKADRPAFFAPHPTLPILYSANEAAHGDGNVSAVRIDHATGGLTLINTVSAQSPGSCYISADRTGRSAFVANYTGGSLSSFTLNPDGSLNPAAGLFDCHKETTCGVPGPNTVPAPNNTRQDGPHFHCATLSPDNRHVLVCDLGNDSIHIFPNSPADMSTGHMRIAARPGSGPRHVVFHPNGRWLYCIHELDCTIDMYDWDPSSATPLTLRPNSTISTLASRDQLPGSTACEIILSPDGRFAYANTRGENSLIVLRIDPKTGLLKEQQRVPSGGTVTRLITFDPSRKWLLCMNQGSSTITIFAHDPTTGHLSYTPKVFPAQTPMCVHFV